MASYYTASEEIDFKLNQHTGDIDIYFKLLKRHYYISLSSMKLLFDDITSAIKSGLNYNIDRYVDVRCTYSVRKTTLIKNILNIIYDKRNRYGQYYKMTIQLPLDAFIEISKVIVNDQERIMQLQFWNAALAFHG